MRLRVLGLAAALMMTTSLAHAEWNADAVAQTYIDQGYVRIEVKIGLTQAKVEAIKEDGTKLEVVYDLATGDILKTETDVVDPGENTTPGVFIRKDDEDFTGTGGDDSTDDFDDGEDDSGDDEGDDHGGDDDGSDDDGEDDDHHGGDDDEGDDDGEDDHHGGDDEEDDDDRSGSNKGRG